jgi:hypothetical protein
MKWISRNAQLAAPQAMETALRLFIYIFLFLRCSYLWLRGKFIYSNYDTNASFGQDLHPNTIYTCVIRELNVESMKTDDYAKT